MVRLEVPIDDELSQQVDLLVDSGIVESRSDAVRRGLLVLLEEERRRAACTAYVEGYRRLPQSADDLGWNDGMSRSMIAGEPW